MKIPSLNILVIVSMAILSLSCGEFEDINVDPNKTVEVAPETLLTGALKSMDFGGNYIPTLYVQYISEIIYTEESRYQTVNWDFNWIYTKTLINLNKIIELNSEEETREEALQSGSNENQIAVARILRSFFFMHATDRWGPLPYSEALKGRENFRPPYSSQKDIYRDIFSELKEAVAQMDDGPPIDGDFLFNGDMGIWKLFANSVRMIAALRIAKVDPAMAAIEFQGALEAGVIQSNAQNIFYPYLAESNNENPWYYFFRTRTDFALSNTMVNKLIALDDPRLYSFGDPAESDGRYVGMPYGVSNPTLDPADVSFPNQHLVRAQATPLPIITYSQILFCQAEAAHLGWINSDPAALYMEAIRSSMQQWQAFDTASFTAYISQPEVRWDPEEAFSLLGTQKWIALFPNGFEAWAEWRRLDYPELKPAPDALNSSKDIPLRQGYPITERDLNQENWRSAVDTWLGGVDDLNGRLWWDVD